ncbi:MAG: hypothetical protein SFX73_37570 [Kofleriaceae bacterium]|nr:hypothetical protein [Kofleriaceae bacterium]
MADHHDDDDDLQLAGMRSLWKSMPDEEPSNNGLAALMAAARAKAEEMKPRESWWQRVLVQLRRPPVLALATVVLLVGGGVVISQRDDMKAEVTANDHAPASGLPSAGSSAGASPAAGAIAPAGQAPLDDFSDGSDIGGKDQAASATEPTSGAAVTPPAPVVASEEKAERSVAKPAKTAPTTATGKAKPKLEVQQRFAPEPAKPAPGTLSEAAQSSKMSIAIDEVADAPTPIEVTSDSKVAAPTAPRRGPVAGEIEKTTPSIDDLIKQCEAAAARGDCASAKNLATRIEKADPKAYRARVSTNATIKPCL